LILFFFFSSRRRHTRLQGDWSSDVCSSDLFFIRGLRIFGILDPPNEPIAQLKLHLAHVQNISAIYLRRARERKDAIQKGSGALVPGESRCTQAICFPIASK